MDNDKFLIDRVNQFKAQVEANDGLTKKQKTLLKALPITRGIVSKAATLVGVSREVHHDAMRDNEEYKRMYKLLEEERTDFVEDCLMQAIGNLDAGLIKYYLSSKAKDRGYQQDVVNNNTINVNPVQFVFTPMIPEQTIYEIKETEELKQIENER